MHRTATISIECGVRRASLLRRIGAAGSGLALCALTACASDDANGVPNQMTNTGVTPGSTATVATTTDAVVDAGMTAPTASGTTSGTTGGTTGTAVEEADAGPSALDAGATTTGASEEAGAPVESGPVVLPAPTEKGPYAVLELDNVGEGYENPIDSNDQGTGGGFCTIFVSLFTDDQQTIDDYSVVPAEYDMALYTLFYPEKKREGETFPVLSWANGTCAHTVGYGEMIEHVVSHGFIVISAHSRFTGSGEAQRKGLDWVIEQNDDPQSPLYGQVDTETVGIFGHSQGGGSTGVASTDPRVDTSILMHGGSISNPHGPVLYLTGQNDSPDSVRSNYRSTQGAAAFGNLANSDHVTMMTEPQRMAPEVTAWFRYTLLGDDEARSWYVGDDCVLCSDSEWEYLSSELP